MRVVGKERALEVKGLSAGAGRGLSPVCGNRFLG